MIISSNFEKLIRETSDWSMKPDDLEETCDYLEKIKSKSSSLINVFKMNGQESGQGNCFIII